MALIREKKRTNKVHTRIFVAVGQRYGDYDHLVCVIYDLYQPFIIFGHKLYISRADMWASVKINVINQGYRCTEKA